MLSTMYVLLGQPAATVALPFWPVGDTPYEARGDLTAPLCDESRRIRKPLFAQYTDPLTRRVLDYANTFLLADGRGGGIWQDLLPAELMMLEETEGLLEGWRAGVPDTDAMLGAEQEFARRAYALLRRTLIPDRPPWPSPVFTLAQNYPNPFNGETTIGYEIPEGTFVTISLFDGLGRHLRDLVRGTHEPGRYSVPLRLDGLATGLYFYRMTTGAGALTRKLSILK